MTKLKDSIINRQLKARISLIILLLITVPVIVHTRSLLLEITRVDAPRWVLEVYALFFAVAFDCSIFMFALYKKREQAVVFAVISGIVGWLFWCSELVFVDMQDEATGQEWARLVMGTLWAGFSAYLVFWCSEIVAESFEFAGSRKLGSRKLEVKKHEVQSRKQEIGKRVRQGHNTLTPRTRTPGKKEQVLELKAAGHTVAEIAEQMGVSDRTVRRYQSNGVS